MADTKTTDVVEKILEESKKLDRKFKQNIDLVINLKNIDLNNPKNRVEQEVILPHGRGVEAKIALFASGELAEKSKKIVDLLIKPEDIEDLSKNKKKLKKIADEHDFFIAEAPLMPTIGKTLGTVLGPRGKPEPHARCARLRAADRGFGLARCGGCPALASRLAGGFWPLALRIDHVLVSTELCVEHADVGESIGSDHRPVIAELRAQYPSTATRPTAAVAAAD